MEVSNVEMTKETSNEKEENDIDSIVELPESNNVLSDLQLQDTFCSYILTQIRKGNIKDGKNLFSLKQDIKKICY